jgi:hypothetical protein
MLENLKQVLNSTRFWSLVLGSLAIYLETKGLIGEAERNLIDTVLGGYITLRTVDKFKNTN